MSARGLLAGLVLALAAASAGGQEPPADSLVEAVEVGFGGVVAHRVPASLWVTLHNRRDRELDLLVVAKSALGEATRAVPLPAGARKRVHLALAAEGKLLLEVRQGGRLLEDRTLPFALVDADRQLLVLDGRPPDRRAGAQQQLEDQVLRFATIDATSAPPEAGCYAAVAAVLLREVDPATWTAEQREALLEHVREGGLVLVAGATPKAPATVRYVEGLPAGPPIAQKVAGLPARVRRLGFGTVMAFADDPLQATLAGPQAADIKARLGELVAGAVQQRRWPRPLDTRAAPLDEHPGIPTQLMVVAFLVIYLLAVGPAVAVALRRAPRRQLALATLALILGFTLVAPLVAGAVRTGQGQARHRAVVWVPADGPALELGEVRVVSGGATRYVVDLEGGGGALAATLVEAVTEPEDPFRVMVMNPMGVPVGARPVAVRTERGERVSLEARMPLWGEQRIFTQLVRPEVRRVKTSATRTASGSLTTIENDTGAPLEDCLIVEEAETRGAYANFVRVGTIDPGERRDVLIPRTIQSRPGFLPEVLDIPVDWTAWLELGVPPQPRSTGYFAPPPSRTAPVTPEPRFRLVSRTEARAKVGGSNLTTVVHALRLDPIQPTAAAARGFLGAVLTDVEEAATCVRCDAKLDANRNCTKCRARASQQTRVRLGPLPGGPCARAGVQDGDVVLEVDGRRVVSSDQLRLLVRERAPGDALRLLVRDAAGDARELRVVLARAPGGSE